MTGAGVMRALAASFRGRRILWWLAAAALAVQLIGNRADVFAIGWAAAAAAVLILLGFAVQYVELRTVRPVKSFLRLALASFSTGLLLIAMPLLLGAQFWVGLILWLGLSFAGLIWCLHYERTEPL
jgi:hypothetical protein